MYSFFEFFAKRHLLANLITVMTILLGAVSLLTIRRDIFPQVEYGVVVITTRYPGASPEDVELNVTNKIEDELKGITGIDKMSSVSMENISVITVKVDPDVSSGEKDKIIRDVEEAVGRVSDFPEEVTDSPSVTEIETAIFPVIEVGLTGDLPYSELREIARLFEMKLESLSGISGVRKHGYLAREVIVEVDPEKAEKYQIPMREIILAVEQRNIRATGGSFESYTSEKNVVTLAQFKNPLEVREVIVRASFDGPLVKIKDLALVNDGFEDERILSRMNGHQAISFQVLKKRGADAIRTVEAIKVLAEKEKEHLPEGIEILFSNDFSKYVSNRLDVVRINGLIGLFLVLLTLSIFLDFRSAFWVAMGIPVTLLGTIFLMPMFGVYLDSISLASMIIVLGIIVDDGIIIAENIQRHREQGDPPLKAAVEGIREVFLPVVTTVLTTFLAFAPMFFMSGIMGQFIFVIPVVITLALFISLLEGVVALPAHLSAGGNRYKESRSTPSRRSWFNRFDGWFNKVLYRALRFRYIIVTLFIAALVGSLWYAANSLKFELFPSGAADKINLLVELPTGTSLRATYDKMVALETIVGSLPESELESFITRVGTQEVRQGAGFPPGENENWAFMIISLTPYSDRTRLADEIVEGLRKQVDTLSGYVRLTFVIERGGPPVGRPITIRVAGNDDDMRIRLADSLEAYLTSRSGIKDIIRDDAPGKDQVEIKVNFDKLSRLGLTVADIAQNVRSAYDGEVVTSVRYGDEEVDFRVQLKKSARTSPRFLANLSIPNIQGRLIALKEVARLETGPGPSNFYHFNEERAITITADIHEELTTPTEAVADAVSHFNLDKDWPGIRFIVGGQAEETAKSMVSLAKAFVIAIVAIYFLLILLFNSVTQPLSVLTIIPFGFMGVILAFGLHDQPLGFIALLGVVGLMGVVINDALVLNVHINNLLSKNDDPSRIRELVAQGTANRLRAVILTTVSTVVGLLPLAYGIGGSDPFIGPMALALGWGLFFATPLTLVLMPSIFMIRHDIKRIFIRR